MALIGHWPLNGDTNDISGNEFDNIISYSNGSFVNGKLGHGLKIENNNGLTIDTTRLHQQYGLNLYDESISF